MAGFVAKWVAKRFLGETLENKFGTEDPYFETVPATRLDGTPSAKKTKKRRKALPPGISEHDGKILTKVKRRAWRLDMSLFSCCGVRFGWSSVIGIIPGFGDILDAFMAMMVLRTCEQIEGGLPADVKARMMFNIVIDFIVGLVPFVGDIADAVFRANTKNAAELEKYLRKKGQATLKAQGVAVPAVDPSDPDQFDQLLLEERGNPPVYTTEAPTGPQPMREQTTGTVLPGTQSDSRSNVRVGDATHPTTTSTKSSGSWFGFGKKKRQPDVETGIGQRREDAPLPNLPTQQSQRIQKPRPTA